MKRGLVVATLLLILSVDLTGARNEIERTMAEELLTLMNVEGTLSAMRENLAKMIETQVAAMDFPEKHKDRFVQHQKKIFDLVFDEMSWKNLKDQYISVYVSVFTQEEIGGLITFYRSPVGQAYIRKTPELAKLSMEVGQSQMERLMPRIMSMAEDLVAEIEAESKQESNPQ